MLLGSSARLALMLTSALHGSQQHTIVQCLEERTAPVRHQAWPLRLTPLTLTHISL